MNRKFFVAGATLLWLAVLNPGRLSAVEPTPPDVLDLVVVDEGAGSGVVTLEAVVRQTVDATAELEIAEPAGTRLVGGQRKKTFTLRRGGTESRERRQIAVGDGQPRTLKATLRLLGPDGKPWLIVERAVKVNQSQAEAADPTEARVPVVQTLPDGTRIVEYIRQKDAVARGLPAEGKPAPSTPRPADDKAQK